MTGAKKSVQVRPIDLRVFCHFVKRLKLTCVYEDLKIVVVFKVLFLALEIFFFVVNTSKDVRTSEMIRKL